MQTSLSGADESMRAKSMWWWGREGAREQCLRPLKGNKRAIKSSEADERSTRGGGQRRRTSVVAGSSCLTVIPGEWVKLRPLSGHCLSMRQQNKYSS